MEAHLSRDAQLSLEGAVMVTGVCGKRKPELPEMLWLCLVKW